MKGLIIKEVTELPYFTNGTIFNSPEFQSIKANPKRFFVLFVDGKLACRVIYYIENNQALSGHQASFGAVDFETELTVDRLKYFLVEVHQLLSDSAIASVGYRLPATIYPQAHLVLEVLTELGFKVVVAETNQHLVIREEKFSQIIRNNERKKLNQSSAANYMYKKLEFSELDAVYTLVSETRSRRGFPVTMSLTELRASFNVMPDQYVLFGLFDEETLIAASVSIMVTNDILYNFYHADKVEYRRRSPLVMLLDNIYQYCQLNKIKVLDLGISTNQGKLNEGLYKFKENLGCIDSKKLTVKGDI